MSRNTSRNTKQQSKHKKNPSCVIGGAWLLSSKAKTNVSNRRHVGQDGSVRDQTKNKGEV